MSIRSFVQDSWRNIVSGVKTAKDKLSFGRNFFVPYSEEQYENIYASDKIARKIVDFIVETALKNQFIVRPEGLEEKQLQEFNEKFLFYLNELNILENIETGLKWARLYGQSYMILGIHDNEDPIEPLDVTRIKKISYSQIFSPREIYASLPDYQPFSKNYLKPEYFNFISYGGKNHNQIHHSRIVQFEGEKLTRHIYIRNRFRHNSVLNPVIDFLSIYGQTPSALNVMLQENSISVFKVKGFANAVMSQRESGIMNRISQANTSKSIINSIVLDADGEEYEKVSGSFSGVGEIINAIREELASRVDIPQKILFNVDSEHNKSGLINNKNDDQSNWQEKVINYQKSTVEPVLRHVFRLLFLSKDFPLKNYIKDPDKFDIQFNSARTMSIEDEAEAMRSIAEADDMFVNMGVLSPTEVRESRFGKSGTFKNFNLNLELDEAISKEIKKNVFEKEENKEEENKDEEKDEEKDNKESQKS